MFSPTMRFRASCWRPFSLSTKKPSFCDPRTARTARHALAAIPDGVALQKPLDGLVVARLHDGDDLTGVVVIELGRRADARADPAVHARVKTLLHPHILHEHIEILPHT